MKIFEGKADINDEYLKAAPQLSGGNPADMFFFDIETTGLSKENCRIYLIGALFLKDGEYVCRQWLSDKNDDEKELLLSFAGFFISYRRVVTFNGDSFDIPFVNERLKKNDISFDLGGLVSIDLYKIIKPLRPLLALDSMKQKSLERFCGLNRRDEFSGGDLIHVYGQYLRNRDDILEKVLLLHNYEDVCNMTVISRLLIHADVFLEKDFEPFSARIHSYTGYDRIPCGELIIKSRTRTAVDPGVSLSAGTFALRAENDILSVRAKMKDGKVRLYRPDYQNYYFLPVEGTAVHKSIAAFVEKSFKEKATPATCFTLTAVTEKNLGDMDFLKKYAGSVIDAMLSVKDL